MKRPLVFLLIMLTVSWILLSKAGNDTDSPLFITEQLLLQEIGEGQNMTLSGTVSKCSITSSGVRLFIDQISILSNHKSIDSILPEQKITITTEQTWITPGDQITLTGTFAPFSSASNPGQFDQRKWYFSQNVVCAMEHVQILQHKKLSGGIQDFLYDIRRVFWESYQRILPEKEAGILAAISLGEKGTMERQWKNQYQEGGIAHIMAVSGLHITLIGMGLYTFLRKILLPIAPSAIVSGIVVCLYGALTGFGISAVRSVLMFLIWLGAQVCGRKYDRITAITIAAAFILLGQPQILKESSFWLSFSAVLIMAVLVPCMEEICQLRSKTGKAFCSSLGIWIGMLPVTLYFFYQGIPWGIIVNLFVLPLMSTVLSMGFISALAGCLHISLGIFLGAPVQYLIRFFDQLCELQKKLPGAVWVTGRPVWWKIVIYYLLLAILVFFLKRIAKSCKKKQILKKIGWFCWCGYFFVGILIFKSTQPDELIVTCLDVGQGDGAVIQIPNGPVCMIDCGSSSKYSIWTYGVQQTLKYYGITVLDYVFLSHGDLDHMSGIVEYLEEYEVGIDGRNVHGITVENLVIPPAGNTDDYEEIVALAKKNEIEIVQMGAGAAIQSEKNIWKIQCLFPNKQELIGDGNQDSMVLRVEYKDFSMLFTGDLELNGEQKLVMNTKKNLLDTDVLKVAHHGSKNSSETNFLQLVSPSAAVISCGKNNTYGHPAVETLERLEKIGAAIFVTSTDGAVQICSDGKDFWVYTYAEETKN